MSIKLEVQFPCETVTFDVSVEVYRMLYTEREFWLSVDGDGQVYATANKPTYYEGDLADECEVSEWWDGTSGAFVGDLAFDGTRDTSHMILHVYNVEALVCIK